MFISRFWTLLLALTAVAMFAIVILATDMVNRERNENATSELYKELEKVDIALNLHARKRLDVLLSVTVDQDVRKILSAVSRDPEKAEKYRQQLLTVLRNRNKDLGKYKADILMALDSRGEVVIQIGKNQREHGYSLAGFPVVDAVLRGYIADDVWKLDNEVYMIAARPIIQNSQFVGAIVHAIKISDALASEISPNMQLGFFEGNVMIAVGSPKVDGLLRAQGSYIGQPLDKVMTDKQFREKGYSTVNRINTKDGDFMAIYSSIRGEASANDVGFAVVTPVAKLAGWTEFYENAGTQDIKKLPKHILIGLLVLAVLLGWFWPWLEAERPLAFLHKSITALENADPKDQLNVYKYRRRLRKIASAFNRVTDIKIKATLDSTGGGGKNINSILGDQGDVKLSSASFKFVEPSADEIPAPPPPSPLSDGRQVVPTPPAATGNKLPPMRPSPPSEAMSPVDEQAYFRKIHADFIALKKRLGEPVEQLTFERFELTLKRNRDALIARYGCKSVKFEVYEKQGKTSLKAIPIKA